MKNYNLSDRQLLIIIFSVILATAISLASDLMYFTYYKVHLFYNFSLIFSGAALTYPITFAITDMIATLTRKRLSIYIGIFIVIADGVFSIIPKFSHLSSYNPKIKELQIDYSAVYQLSGSIWNLWFTGVVASTITVIAEILLFSYIVKKICKNVGVAIVLSTALTLAVHNAILDWHMLRDIRIILGNYTLNVLVVSIYAIIISFLLKKKNNK